MSTNKLIESLAALKTDEELRGGKSGDDAVEELDGFIRAARVVIADAHQGDHAAGSPEGHAAAQARKSADFFHNPAGEPRRVTASTVDVNPHIMTVMQMFGPDAAELQMRLDAIQARIRGEWDNPALMAFGALATDAQVDILRIADGERPEDDIEDSERVVERARG